MPQYAKQTTVTEEQSRAEIEKILVRYGVTGFIYAWHGESAVIMFEMKNRRIRFKLPLPDQDDGEFWYTPERKTRRTPTQAKKAWIQARRQRWRALLLIILAKLEAIESGITTFEDEFLAHTLLPNGQTVGEWIQPQMDSTDLPPMLPGIE